MTRDARELAGRWVHVHEEDGPQFRVFRRAGVRLPPSRGRTELDIAPDLSVRQIGPGENDRPAAKPASRLVYGDLHGPDSAAIDLEVTDFTGDRLLIRKR